MSIFLLRRLTYGVQTKFGSDFIVYVIQQSAYRISTVELTDLTVKQKESIMYKAESQVTRDTFEKFSWTVKSFRFLVIARVAGVGKTNAVLFN